MEEKPITISLGPQFSGALSRLVMLVTVLVVIQTIYAFAIGEYVFGMVAALVGVLIAPLFLDYRGVQIDLANQQIRKYRAYLGLRWGQWLPLSPYEKLILHWQRLRYKSGGSATALMGPRGSTRSSDVYCVSLTGSEVETFELADLESHRAAKRFMAKYAKLLHLPAEDKYQKRMEAAYKRRQEVEARRGRK